MQQFFARHSFKVILLAVFLLPMWTRGARKAITSNDNNVHDWLPREYAETQEFSWFQNYFDNETFVLMSWDGCTLDDDRLELFARKLVPEEIEPVDPPEPRNKAEAIAMSKKESRYFKRVETGTRLIARLTSPPLNLDEDEAKKRLEGLFIGPDQQQTCALVTLTDTAKADLRGTLKRIRDMAQNELDIPPERLHLGGPPVDNVAISVEGEANLIRLIVPAAIVGVALAFWCLRSVRLTTMVFGAALYAASLSLAIVYYTGGTMNAIMMSMPSVVYVAGVSGAIHFANYYRDSVVEKGVKGAAARAVQHAWLPCILSAGTSAAGLLSLYTSELVPIRNFGLYSALGVLATLFLVFFYLPSVMTLWPMKLHSMLDGDAPKQEDLALPARWRRILGGVMNYHRLTFAALVAVMIFCGFGLSQVGTSIKLTKLFSPNAQIIHDYQWLEGHLGPLVPMEIVLRVDNTKCDLTFLERMELVSRVQDAIEDIDGIGNTMSAVTYAPSLEVKRKGPFISKTMARNILNKKLVEHREEYLDNDFIAEDGDTELWRISARVGALNDIDYGAFVSDIRSRVEPVLQAERERIVTARAKQGTAQVDLEAAEQDGILLVSAAEAADVPAPEQEPVQSPVTLDAGAVPTELPADATANDEGIGAVYTGLVPLVYKAQRSMLNGLAWNFITDVLTIALVMTIVFRDLSAGLILLVPSVFPVMVVFGLMGWSGVLIDVGTIMTPTVALGVSVDDVVHFLIWYRNGLREGKTRKQAVMQAYEGCARAMYQSWAVLGLGLAVFALSTFVPTQRFGAMMALLLTAALVGNLLLLPAVLVSPLGWFFGRRLMKEAQRKGLGAAKSSTELLSTINQPAASSELGADGPHDVSMPIHMRRDASHRNANF